MVWNLTFATWICTGKRKSQGWKCKNLRRYIIASLKYLRRIWGLSNFLLKSWIYTWRICLKRTELFLFKLKDGAVSFLHLLFSVLGLGSKGIAYCRSLIRPVKYSETFAKLPCFFFVSTGIWTYDLIVLNHFIDL